MADSYWCMAITITILKSNYSPLKINKYIKKKTMYYSSQPFKQQPAEHNWYFLTKNISEKILIVPISDMNIPQCESSYGLSEYTKISKNFSRLLSVITSKHTSSCWDRNSGSLTNFIIILLSNSYFYSAFEFPQRNEETPFSLLLEELKITTFFFFFNICFYFCGCTGS